ncbi:hypothetical protein GCM10009830_33250 [Glycomyces endophyticus]|uniref:Uncharacterized protein n=1 Tax=Glycomyces endophyticus TaxID=480996 RepID=A0ABP4T725_9ACTN
MRLKLRRSPVEAARTGDTQRAAWTLPAGTALGWFVEAGLRFEVQLAAERRLWLRCRPAARGRDLPQIDVGPVVWDAYRSPHLNSVPEWLDASATGTAAVVLKSTALYRAVVLGEALDPTLDVEISADLGELVYQADPAPQAC